MNVFEHNIEHNANINIFMIYENKVTVWISSISEKLFSF